MASPVFDEPEQGRTGGLRLSISRTSPSMRRRPRRVLREAGDGIEIIRTIGLVRAVTKRAGASTKGTGGLPDAGERIRTHRSARNISLGADDPGRTLQRTDHLCRRGTVRVHHCRPEDRRLGCHPGEERACSSLGETKGRARLPRPSWVLDWRRFKA